MTASLQRVSRRPKRITITVSQSVSEHLFNLSDEQGRSTSNLAAYLLEYALQVLEGETPIAKRWPSKTA